MKYVLLVGAVVVLLWMLFGRGRVERVQRRAQKQSKAAPVAMVECAHCGVHLPPADAEFDAAGLPYCGQAHRIAGARKRE
jgi:uncharacterized protein